MSSQLNEFDAAHARHMRRLSSGCELSALLVDTEADEAVRVLVADDEQLATRGERHVPRRHTARRQTLHKLELGLTAPLRFTLSGCAELEDDDRVDEAERCVLSLIHI